MWCGCGPDLDGSHEVELGHLPVGDDEHPDREEHERAHEVRVLARVHRGHLEAAESSRERGSKSQREEEVGVLLVLMQADGWRLWEVVLFMQAADCLGYVVGGRW